MTRLDIKSLPRHVSLRLYTRIRRLPVHVGREEPISRSMPQVTKSRRTVVHIPYSHRVRYPPSSTFLAFSTIFLTSACPFSTIFSIRSLAFFRSSGRALLLTCIERSFFCCLPLPSLILVLAFSPAFVASLTVARRDSAVGGGMLITRRSGLLPVGSG